MALKMFTVKFANKQDIKQWGRGTFENNKSSRILEKMQRISARKEYISMNRPEICEVAEHYNRQCFRYGK